MPQPVLPPPTAANPPTASTPGPTGTSAPETRVGLSDQPLPTGLEEWAVEPRCGAVVSFRGMVRDHAEGRDGVEALIYEAYEDVAVGRMEEVVAEARRRWPTLGRVAALHRTGELAVGDVAVVVVVAAPHRDEAFEAGRWLIDAVKASVPIWKRERWSGGDGWGTGAQPLRDPADVARTGSSPDPGGDQP